LHFNLYDVQQLAEELKNHFPEARALSVWVSFYPYKNLSHTIRLREGVIYIRLSDKMTGAPRAVWQSLLLMLMARLFRYQVDPGWRKVYRHYVASLVEDNPPDSRAVAETYQAAGTFFNLEERFHALNKRFFDGRLKKPVLGWSQRESLRRLGFFDAHRQLLVVSRSLDRKRTPGFVIDYILYHEMLHIAIPVEVVNGRRRIHPPEFKRRERLYPDFERAQNWVRKHFRKTVWRIF